MRVLGTSAVSVEISKHSMKDIAEAVVRSSCNLASSFYVKNGKILRSEDVQYGAHSKVETTVICEASELQEAAYRVIQAIRKWEGE